MADPVSVVSPLGSVQEVSPEEAAGLVATEGWRHAAPEEAEQARLQAKHGGFTGAAMAAVTGGLRGASVGGSDALLSAIGGEDVRKGLAELREANPMASLGGEVGGSLLRLNKFRRGGLPPPLRAGSRLAPIRVVARPGSSRPRPSLG